VGGVAKPRRDAAAGVEPDRRAGGAGDGDADLDVTALRVRMCAVRCGCEWLARQLVLSPGQRRTSFSPG
jgi:hypothetical protein